MRAEDYPTSATVHVGVECPFCLVPEERACVTTGDHPFAKECHAQRTKLFKERGIEPVIKARGQHIQGFDPEPASDDAGIKLALWYLRKAGSIENAHRFLEVAVDAMDKASKKKSKK